MSEFETNNRMNSAMFTSLVEKIKQRDFQRKKSLNDQRQKVQDQDSTVPAYPSGKIDNISSDYQDKLSLEDLTEQLLTDAKIEEEREREWRYWRERAMNFLIRREHSEVELRQKLQQRQCPPKLLDPIIDWLYGERYLSLERFAYSYSKNRADLGYGPIRVRYELAQIHRISEKDIKAAFEEINWHSARAIAERKVGQKEGAKYYAALYRRGFSSEMIVEDDR